MDFDLAAAEWLLPDVLQCVRGLTQASLQQRISRGLVRPEVPSRQGRPSMYNGYDVVQIALHHVLTRQGILSTHADFIWKEVVRPRIVKRAKGDDGNRVAALLHVDHNGDPRVLFVDENRFVLKSLDSFEDDDEPVRAVLRVDHFIDMMVGRMQCQKEVAEDYDPGGVLRARSAT